MGSQHLAGSALLDWERAQVGQVQGEQEQGEQEQDLDRPCIPCINAHQSFSKETQRC